MPFQATAYQVFIASPSDVSKEREIIRNTLHRWNDLHSSERKEVLLPVGWETHTAPMLGEKPQDIINRQALETCDLLICVFWTRLGTPTDNHESGTVEEIKKHRESNKPAMVYFSSSPTSPENINSEQYNELLKFKEWCKKNGLYNAYENREGFGELLYNQLNIALREPYFQGYRGNSKDETGKQNEELSEEAKTLLINVSKDRDGGLLKQNAHQGFMISTNGRGWPALDPETSIRFSRALTQLLDRKLISKSNAGQGFQSFQLTEAGYQLANRLLGD
jgi:hypothetical protein